MTKSMRLMIRRVQGGRILPASFTPGGKKKA
ncbi:protein of unknown function [Methylacidimicrobium sp. AP8]|nr:protein of unknown function [Methylacidimicrobium sp. AP8]